MLIAAPLQYNAIMARCRRARLSPSTAYGVAGEEEGADFTCPLTAGIFIQICAWASEERAGNGFPPSRNKGPGRTLKASGEQNEKEPGGSDGKGLSRGRFPIEDA